MTQTSKDETAERAPRVHRSVVSYVRRSARMRPHQRATLDAHRDRLLIEVPRGELSTSVAAGAGPLDLVGLFGRRAPLIVEIGPGTGDSLVPMAAARPEADVLAFEVYEPAVARVVAGLARAGLTNVRVVQADAVQGLRELLPAAAVTELWTFFPDPWPKARHHKRRLVSADFADLAASRVEVGGLWWLATDWADYADHIAEVLDAHPDWVRDPAREDRAARRPTSRFEQRGRRAGRDIVDLAYRRR